jgi:hypothetical protein
LFSAAIKDMYKVITVNNAAGQVTLNQIFTNKNYYFVDSARKIKERLSTDNLVKNNLGIDTK